MTTTVDVYGEEHQVDTKNLNFSVHVYGIALDHGKILISPQYGGYDFPGGTAEKGETHIETLIREFREETGYTVEPVKLLGVYTSFFHHITHGKDYQSYLIYYQVRITGGKLSDNGLSKDEKQYAELAKWVSLESLKTLKHACSVKNVANELIENLTL